MYPCSPHVVQDIHDKVTKLRMMADRMCGANHFASEDLKLYIGKLIGRWSRHKDMMEWRKAILEKSIEFHETENKVSVMVMVVGVTVMVCVMVMV